MNKNVEIKEIDDNDKIYIAMLEERISVLEDELKELKLDYAELDNEFSVYVMEKMPMGTEH